MVILFTAYAPPNMPFKLYRGFLILFMTDFIAKDFQRPSISILSTADNKFIISFFCFGDNKTRHFMSIICQQTISTLFSFLQKQQNLKMSSAAN